MSGFAYSRSKTKGNPQLLTVDSEGQRAAHFPFRTFFRSLLQMADLHGLH